MIHRLLLLLLAVLPLAASAGALTDLLMAPNLFDKSPVGTNLAYAEHRTVPKAGSLTGVDGGEVRLEVVAIEGGQELRMTREDDGHSAVRTFPSGVANPVLIYFLDTTVRAMAEATGGSSFYIRNRIREALAASGVGPDAAMSALTIRPFQADANRARMGVFGDLAIRLRFDPAAPSRILELSADTPSGVAGYTETLVLIPED